MIITLNKKEIQEKINPNAGNCSHLDSLSEMQKVVNWCNEHIEDNQWSWLSLHKFYFSKDEDALYFKMVWG